jgi:excisionase family DNA binding protein
MSQPNPSPYFTIPETARYLRISERTVFNLLRIGKLKAIKLGRRTLVPFASIQALVAQPAL